MEDGSSTFGEEAGRAGSRGEGIELWVVGGGSMGDGAVAAFVGTAGSGSAGMASSAEDVSIAIEVVGFDALR